MSTASICVSMNEGHSFTAAISILLSGIILQESTFHVHLHLGASAEICEES